MTTQTTSQPPRTWRIVLFSIVSGLIALLQLFVFGGAFSILEPWGIQIFEDDPTYHGAIHLWHQGQWAALMGLLLSSALIMLLYRPQTKPVLMQFYVLSMGVFAVLLALAPHADITPEEWGLALVFALAAAATYPAPRELLRFGHPGAFSRPLLGLTGLSALVLMPISWSEWQMQGMLMDEHAHHYHYASAVVLAAIIVLAGALATTKRPGSKALGLLIGMTLLYLGAAAIATPGQAGSWGIVGGVVACLGGAAFIATTVWEARTTAASTSISSATVAELAQ